MAQKLFLRKVSDMERETDVGLRECETEKFLNALLEERTPESIWQQETGLAGAVPEAGNRRGRETGEVTGDGGDGNGVSIAAVPERFTGMWSEEEETEGEAIPFFAEAAAENPERRTEREGETIETLFRKRGFRITGSARRSGSRSDPAAGLPDVPDVSSDCGMPQDVTQLACRMAKEYRKLRKFCHMLRSCNSGVERKFSYIAPAEDGECVIHFAEDLRKYGVLILPDRISTSAGCPERTICGDIADIPRVISFFNGQWLERFASVEAEKAARETAARLGTDYEVLEGAGIEEIATGKTNELDVVIRIGKSLFWIECKCGSFHESAYLKYYRLGKRISVVPDHMILLAADLADREKGNVISYFYQYQVCGPEEYGEHLRKMFGRAEV